MSKFILSKFLLIKGSALDSSDGEDQDLIMNIDNIIGAKRSDATQISLTVVGSNANFRLVFIDSTLRDLYWALFVEVMNPLEAPSISRNIK